MIVATAPVRVADAGGWTDTWFAERGAVCNVAVGPGARVEVRPRTDADVVVTAPQVADTTLLRLAVDHTGVTGVDVHVSTWVPPGSSLGSSAAVLVALVGALAAVRGEALDPDEAARRAHHVETVVAGRESGVQDHVAAAHGGASWIDVQAFPAWRWKPVDAPQGLADRLLTVHLGGGHDSSALHRAVIDRAEAGDGHVHRVLGELTTLADAALTALVMGDVDAWGRVLTEATEAQARLHPDLVGGAARRVGEVALAHGAAGWKVNGAGGPGGTVTIVGPTSRRRRRALVAALPVGTQVLDVTPSPGLVVTAG